MKQTPYDHNCKEQRIIRQSLRNNATSVESILWKALKGKQVDGLKFRRQFGVGPYILDFYCPEIRLGIELDGEVHKSAEAHEYDEIRSTFMKKNRIGILRFDNDVVTKNMDAIIEAIKKARTEINTGTKGATSDHPHPLLTQEGRL